MHRVLIVCAIAGILSLPAKADETLKWRHVQYATSLQTLPVGDTNGHSLGLYHLSGIAFFPDGSIGTSSVVGTTDAIPDVGTAQNGYYAVNFPDGSTMVKIHRSNESL
jgi:hypothetical protein